jgi:hypothetical protein
MVKAVESGSFLIVAVLALVDFGGMWLQTLSPLRRAFDEIQVGMTPEQVTEALDRSGWGRVRWADFGGVE